MICIIKINRIIPDYDEIIIEATLSTSYAANILVPAFNIQNHVVWGATAMMLSELREVLKITFEEKI